MLTITVGATEFYDESKGEFVTRDGVTLELEHSLVSLSKWEAIHERPFLDGANKSGDDVLSYVQCMMLTKNPPEEILNQLSQENWMAINNYLEAKMTATWFSEMAPEPRRSSETLTSELIYYWMTVFQIPFECETWHLNRLFTLIRICNMKQTKPKKMSRSEIAARNRELNAKRKAQMGTNG